MSSQTVYDSKVECLILSHSVDYSTDLICFELKKRGVNYLRLNRDSFADYKIQIDVSYNSLFVSLDGSHNYYVESIYFRAPVFLRTNKKFTLDEQVYRSQWSSFLRNLIIFDKATWLNHPVSIYRAENKIFQLKEALSVGLNIPKTIISNFPPKENIFNYNEIAVKSLDTALFHSDDEEFFVYTSAISRNEITEESLKLAPVIMQEFLDKKIDIRITAIGETLYPVKVLSHGNGISGDWRREKKENLEYVPFDLPGDIQDKLLRLMANLDLSFGGIDLMLSDNKYYFVEVNPTGEWGWLTRTSNIPIDKAIVDFLCREN